LRAAHLIIDGAPPVLNDTIVARLLDADIEDQIRSRADELQTAVVRGLRAHVLLRGRFAEDSLMDAVARGAEQYVLLGAGLDTFPYRQPSWSRGIAIVEVDRSVSQAAKRAALFAAGVEIPANVSYADVDFERETLAAALARSGLRTNQRTFFSWLGVTMYLTRDAIETTLKSVLSFPRGSEIVFTFAQPNPDATSAGAKFAEGAASVGEPWISYFTPDEVGGMLGSLGFSAVRLLSREEAVERYFHGRSDGLAAPRRVSIASAVV
jgi:methyltransferase (TIGR00027 family)